MHAAAEPGYFKPFHAEPIAKWFQSILSRDDARAWIADADGQPVGYACAFFYDRPESPFCLPRRWCELDQIAVEPGSRKHGVGRMLVEAVLGAARADGFPEVELTTWHFNAEARRLFCEMGFASRSERFVCRP